MTRAPARSRAILLLAVAAALGVVIALAVRGGSQQVGKGALRPAAGGESGYDPLRYVPARRTEFERRAAAGVAHVLYAKSPGGIVASARRTARWRPLVERAAKAGGVDPDVLEAIVLLESAGRPNAQASTDLHGAAGLTQILAETGTSLLGMRVDVPASTRLTRGVARGRKVAARTRARRRVDERFDPAKALAATVRYLRFARSKLGSDELAVESYHMGVGNLQQALAAYGDDRIPYAQLFFDSTPLHHAAAYRKLAALGDDSSTYLWRIRAAEDVMRRFRDDPRGLATLALRQTSKASAEEVLHPPATTEAFADPFALGRARVAGRLVSLPAGQLAGDGIRISPRMGELARRLNQSPRLYRALRPEALAALRYIGAGVRTITGDDRAALTLTSTVRDRDYQRVLVARNIEATRGYSLHTTGYAFDVSRTYASRAQALAFQFMLDRLTALDVIAWVREPEAIHVTAGPLARELVAALR